MKSLLSTLYGSNLNQLWLGSALLRLILMAPRFRYCSSLLRFGLISASCDFKLICSWLGSTSLRLPAALLPLLFRLFLVSCRFGFGSLRRRFNSALALYGFVLKRNCAEAAPKRRRSKSAPSRGRFNLKF